MKTPLAGPSPISPMKAEITISPISNSLQSRRAVTSTSPGCYGRNRVSILGWYFFRRHHYRQPTDNFDSSTAHTTRHRFHHGLRGFQCFLSQHPCLRLSLGMRGLPPRLASTTSLSAVGASIMANSLAVNIIGRTSSAMESTMIVMAEICQNR